MKNNKIQNSLIKDILEIANKAASNALQAVNTQLVIRNWLIGKRIDEEILTTRSNDYGKGLIKQLSKQLIKYGRGFGERRLYEYVQFYKFYPSIFQIDQHNCTQENILRAPAKSLLLWGHYELLIRIKDKIERDWYENSIRIGSWSYRQLKRNITTDVYHRTMSNLLKNNNFNLEILNNYNYLKSLMIFEFLNINKKDKIQESDLESSLIKNIGSFLLELGRGYAFIGKQIHLRTNNNNYYIDLVFYNTILKRYLLIDLKVGEIKHKDIGQMLFYLRLFDKQNNIDESSKTIGMILSSDLNSDIVKYLMDKTKDNVVASKYLTYLPTKEEIRRELLKINKYK